MLRSFQYFWHFRKLPATVNHYHMSQSLVRFALTMINFIKNPSESTFADWIEVANKEGAIAQKVTQVLSQRSEVVPRQWRERIQAHVCANIAHHSWAWSKEKLSEFVQENPKYKEILVSAQEVPLASGTTAQVHLAGQYAIKILHPLDDEVARWRAFLPPLRRAFSLAGFDALGQLVQFGVMAVEMQLDLRQELRNMQEIAQAPAVQALLQTGKVIVPLPHAANKNVLVMECVNVKTLSALAHEMKTTRPLDLQQLRRDAFLASYVFTICTIGDGQVGNCDLHPGNIGCCFPEASTDGSLQSGEASFVIYDYGMCSVWTPKYLQIFRALFSADLVGAFASVVGKSAEPMVARCVRNSARRLSVKRPNGEAIVCGFAQLYEDTFKEMVAQDMQLEHMSDVEAVDCFCQMLTIQHLNEGLRAVDHEYQAVKEVSKENDQHIQRIYKLGLAVLMCMAFKSLGLPPSTCEAVETSTRVCRSCSEEVCKDWMMLVAQAQATAEETSDMLRASLLRDCAATLREMRA